MFYVNKMIYNSQLFVMYRCYLYYIFHIKNKIKCIFYVIPVAIYIYHFIDIENPL